MKRLLLSLALTTFLVSYEAHAGRFSREISKLTGWTIVQSSSVSEVIADSGMDKVIKLRDGVIIKTKMCVIITPMVSDDVILFGKKIGGVVMMKAAIDDDVCDIEIVN